MKKSLKFTEIYFNEAEPLMEINTANVNLKHRLTAFAKAYPGLCRIIDEDGCMMSFQIDKHRCSLRVTAPYTEARRSAIRETAKACGIHTRKNNTGDGADV